jgi:hypothetical protein
VTPRGKRDLLIQAKENYVSFASIPTVGTHVCILYTGSVEDASSALAAGEYMEV